MKFNSRLLAFALSVGWAIWLCGCSSKELMNQLPRAEAKANNAIQLLRKGDFATLKSRMDLSLKGPDIDRTLGEMQALFPENPPASMKTVGFRSVSSADGINTSVVIEYGFDDGTWIIADVSFRTKDNEETIVGFHTAARPESLENLNRFTLAGRTLWQYIALLLTCACGAFTLYALVVCIRTKIRRKGLWVLLTLCGVLPVTVNWTTAQTNFRLLWVQIPPVNVVHADYQPWYLIFCLPLGAVIFLLKRKNSLESSDC